MKTKLFLFTLTAFIFSHMQTEAQKTSKRQKVLVVYFSYTGNTRELAKQIHEQVGGDMVELELVTPYSKDYKTVEKQGQDEVHAGYKPPLKTKIDSIQTYDVIFIGSPIWWFTIAPPISTFLSQYDLSGKQIIPFITHGGYGLGRSINDIKKLSPKSTLLKEYEVEGNQVKTTKEKMKQWLKTLKL